MYGNIQIGIWLEVNIGATRYKKRSSLQVVILLRVKEIYSLPLSNGGWRVLKYSCPTGTKKERKISSLFFVPRIGLEPTCREALAPETSVSTISPPGLVFDLQIYDFFSFGNIFGLFFCGPYICKPYRRTTPLGRIGSGKSADRPLRTRYKHRQG